MDFTKIGGVEVKGASYRAHAVWKDSGVNRHIRGPCRPDQEAAQKDLDSMRSAASGREREQGFTAMAKETNRLREDKTPKEEGSVTPFGMGVAACIQWREAGTMRHAYGPRRYEQRRAQEDLEAMREAASAHDDALTRKQAIAAEARRLQQQAETERRVSILAHRQQDLQPVQEQQARHAQSHQASEEL